MYVRYVLYLANCHVYELCLISGQLSCMCVSEKAPSLGENKDTVARNVVGESALACTQTRIKDIPMLINAQGEVNEITEQKKLLEELVPSANWLAVGWIDGTLTSGD